MYKDIIRALSYEEDYKLISEGKEPVKLRNNFYVTKLKNHKCCFLDDYYFTIERQHPENNIRNRIHRLIENTFPALYTSNSYSVLDYESYEIESNHPSNFQVAYTFILILYDEKPSFSVIYTIQTICYTKVFEYAHYSDPCFSKEKLSLNKLLKLHSCLFSEFICKYGKDYLLENSVED